MGKSPALKVRIPDIPQAQKKSTYFSHLKMSMEKTNNQKKTFEKVSKRLGRWLSQ